MPSRELVNAWRFHLEHGGYCTPPGRAACALSAARAELAYQAVEVGEHDAAEPGAVRFRWEWDDMTPEDAFEDPRDIAYAREHGLVGCILERLEPGKPACVVCGAAAVPPRWQHVASLWGISESPDNRERDAYRRVIQAELALEAGL